VDTFVHSVQTWLLSTSVGYFMTHTNWAWSASESLHFIGLCLLIGTVGVFDLRMIGLIKKVPIAALHSLIPIGIAGYCMNVLTGFTFLTGAADQYIYNPAFQTKIAFMTVAGVNVALFYLTMYKRVATTAPEDEAPLSARIAGAVSLICWIGVIVSGRMLTFFRPPWHWCPWC
jgi:hypothetical protein